MFSSKYIERITQEVSIPKERLQALDEWKKFITSQHGAKLSETQLHEQFYTDLFVKVLGYEKRSANSDTWTIQSENKTDVDATRSDGVLGFFTNERCEDDIQAVIELKSPNVDLDLRQNRSQDKRTPIDQAFSYAHKHENVKWVIVSNFKELRLYQSHTSKHSVIFNLETITNDSSEVERKLFYLLLSSDNLLSDDKESHTQRLTRKREEELKQISDNFYRDYKDVRLQVSQFIFNEHPNIDVDKAINLTQTIIDRVLFIAFIEDIGLTKEKLIEKAFTEQNAFHPVPLWQNFQSLFQAMDKGNLALSIPPYNGGLFRENPDIKNLHLSDKILKQFNILANYDFGSDLSVNILGHVFEQSITDLSVLKSQLHGVENHDTRRHDEGAFYTPDTITSYIVEKTIGTYLQDIRNELGGDTLPQLKDKELTDENKKTNTQYEARKQHIEFWEKYREKIISLKIIDPSCGSGAFLTAVFDYLVKEGERINKEFLRLNARTLLLRWDREILKNNIYGVDISHEAVEITKLSLWLKIAKNKEKLLALDNNIKQTDAVAGTSWQDLFPDIIKQGGFDIVLGNPPYVRHELIKDIKPILKEGFTTYTGTSDLYIYFYELGYNLLKQGGYLGYISSNKWMRARYGEKLRSFIKDKTTLTSIIDLTGQNVFDDATVDTNILTLKKESPNADSQLIISDLPFYNKKVSLKQKRLSHEGYNLESNPLFWSIQQKMQEKGTPLKEWDIDINYGIKTGFNEAFIIDTAKKDEFIKQNPQSIDIIKPLLRGRDVKKWHVDWQDLWLIFTRKGIIINDYPAIKTHLENYKIQLQPRNKGQKIGRKAGDYEWYEIQDTIAYHEDFEKPKIIYPDIDILGRFYLDTSSYFHNNTAYHITGSNLECLSAFLNTSIVRWFQKKKIANLGDATRAFEIYIRELPIPKLSETEQRPFIQLSKELHHLTQKRYDTSKGFLSLLQQEFSINTLNTKLKQWDTLTFADFLKTLNSYKIFLQGKQKEDWYERFNRIQTDIKELNTQILKNEYELNQHVYTLYGLTKEESIYVESQSKL